MKTFKVILKGAAAVKIQADTINGAADLIYLMAGGSAVAAFPFDAISGVVDESKLTSGSAPVVG